MLTPLEFRLLAILVRHRETVLPRDTLLADVWKVSLRTTTRTVDTHVKRLRDKLGSAGRFVQTVRGVGYRFSEEPRPARTAGGEGTAGGDPSPGSPPRAQRHGLTGVTEERPSSRPARSRATTTTEERGAVTGMTVSRPLHGPEATGKAP